MAVLFAADPASSRDIEEHLENYRIITLTSLMGHRAAVTKSCGDVHPKYCNYLVENNVEIRGLMPVVVGRVIEHNGSSLRQSSMPLVRHLRLDAVEEGDVLAFSLEDFRRIEDALRESNVADSFNSVKSQQHMSSSDFPLGIAFGAAIFFGIAVGGLSADFFLRLYRSFAQGRK